MLEQLKHLLLKDRKVQVIGVHYDASDSYSYLKVAQTNDELKIVENENFKDKETLFEKVSTSIPVLLCFTGKGVMNKKVKITPDYRSKILLNVSPDDFYFYEFIQNKEAFVSVIRKSQADLFFDACKQASLMVVDYSVGGFIGYILQPFINREELIVNQLQLIGSGGQLIDFKQTKSNEVYPIGDEKLNSDIFGLYATVLNYYSPNEALVYDQHFLTEIRVEKNYKRYFEVFGVAMLVLFFVSLLTSYLLLGSYNSKIVMTNSSLLMVQDSFERIKKLEDERDEKRKILHESGVFTQEFLSVYANQITQGLPKTIALATLKVFPLDKKIKHDEKVNFIPNTVVVSGESSSNIEFNTWYKNLKQLAWVKKVDIEQYQANKKNKYDFEIKLMIE